MEASIWLTFKEVGTSRNITLLFGPGGICAFKEVYDADLGEDYALLFTAGGQEWKVYECANRLADLFCDDEAG